MSADTLFVRDLEGFRRWAARDEVLAGGLVFVGPEPEYGIGLEAVLPRYAVACADDSPAANLLAERVPLRSLLRGARERGETEEPGRSAAALLEDESLGRWIAAQWPGASPSLLVFKSSHRLEALCQARGWPLLAPPAMLARRWENKVAFRSLAERLGLPQPPGRVFDAEGMGYADLAAQLGERFVVQAPHGYGGARTSRVDSQAAFAAALEGFRARRLRATAYVEGRPLTLSACVTARGVAASAPFCQVTGEPELTLHRLGSCGNDWTTAARLGIDPAPFVALAERIGAALALEGYRGIFGVDFVQPEGQGPVVIEVNPRLVASVALHAQLELAAGRLPLLARHLLAQIAPELDQAPLDLHQAPLDGGQVILHNLSADDRRSDRALETGAYRLAEGPEPLRYARPALRVDELGPGELLLLAPDPKRIVPGGQAWGRLQGIGPVMDEAGRLRPEISAAAEQLGRQTGFGVAHP